METYNKNNLILLSNIKIESQTRFTQEERELMSKNKDNMIKLFESLHSDDPYLLDNILDIIDDETNS